MAEYEELVLPTTGELVSLEDEAHCVRALVEVRDLERQLREVKTQLTAAIIERAKVLGTQTLNLPDGSKASVKGGSEISYDAQEIMVQLRELGMPEERISEIVVEEVSYRVSAREAKRAAAANPEYKAVIEGAATTVEKPTYISVQKKH